MKIEIQRKGKRGIFFSLLAIAFLFIYGSGPSASAQTTSGNLNGTNSTEENKVNVLGVQVAVDPKTGKIRQPTREEARALYQGMQKLLSRSTEGLTIVHHANGAKSVDLQGRFQALSLARVNPDGTLSTECALTSADAAKFLGLKPNSRSRLPNKKSPVQRSVKKMRLTRK